MTSTGITSFKPSDLLTDYLTQVCDPFMSKADLAPLTMNRYTPALRMIAGTCSQHRHVNSLKGHTISSAIRYRVLEAMLTEVARLHGFETARQVRTVLNRYVVTPLIRDELVSHNPIAGVPLSQLTGMTRGPRTRGGRALTPTQVDQVLDHLLRLDPASYVLEKRGKWSLEVIANKKRNAIDQLLIQLSTGLRSTETNLIRWDDIVTREGMTWIDVREDVGKGHRSRRALILQPRVITRLDERRELRGDKGYVIGAPADAEKVWEARNRNKAAAELYTELATDLGITVMAEARSHVWRTTLRTHYDGKAPDATLNAQFGHGKDVAQRHYIDTSDLSTLARAAGIDSSG